MALPGQAQGLYTIVSGKDPITVPLKIKPDQLHRFGIIINDQNPFPCHLPTLLVIHHVYHLTYLITQMLRNC